MHQKKELVFNFIMKLIFSRCYVRFCLIITAHYIWSTPYHTTCLFSCYIIIIMLNLNLSSPASLKP